jgi:glycine/D-amino acid oxidase-like deaminating enzyme
MDAEPDILIIGAGLAGASTACSLRRRGVRDVLVVEQEAFAGVHSSGRSAALVRVRTADPDILAMASEGAGVLRTGEPAPFRRTGSILIGQGDEDVAGRFPPARGHGLWSPDDGVVDVAALLRTYLAGQAVRYNTRVLGIDPSGDRLAVETTQGVIRAKVVVNAAGPWAGVVGDIDLTPMNRHLFVTPPRGDIGPDWPFVWHDAEGLYFRPESGGLLLCACDETPAAPGDYRDDRDVMERLCDLVTTLQPGLGDIAVMNRWVGQRTFATDRRFVIGYDPRDPRLFHVAGLGGHGVTCSPAVGRLAADLLIAGPSAGSNPFDPARLASAKTKHPPFGG